MAWPKTDDPRTEFTTVRFTRSEAADIDSLIATDPDNYPSRSAVVRAATDLLITRERRKQKKAKKGAK